MLRIARTVSPLFFVLLGVLPAAAQVQPNYGAALAVDGRTLLVGDPGTEGRAGRVYIYDRAGDAWRERAQLGAPDAKPGDGFGSAIALAGGQLLVGASSQQEGGAAYFFTRGADGSWQPAGRLEASGASPGDGFGRRVAIDGEHAFVAAPFQAGRAGAVYVFRRSGAEWAQVAKLTGAGESAFFGARLALAGGRALIGAYGENNATGAVYPFTFADGTWQAGEKLVADQPQPQTGFGYALDLTAEHAFVSAPRAAGGAGAIYAFRAAGDGWTPAGTITAPDSAANEMFGAVLARAGTDLLIGASSADDRRGAIYTLREASGSWTVAGRVSSPVAQRGQFGSAVAAGAEVVVAAIPGADFGLGRVAVLERQGDQLRVVAQLEGEGPATLPALTGDERRCSDADSVAVFGCRDVDLLAFLPVKDIGGSRGVQLNDVWGWTDPESNREYAIVGRMDGTSFIDVSDPENPVYLGDLPLTEGANPNMWRDMKVYRNHVFIVADAAGEHGMQVFDLTRLRSVPAGTPAKFAADVTYDRINSAHNIVINEESGFAYIVGSSGGESCGGGLHMVDIREPHRPTFAGCFADPQTGRASTGYTHDAQCVMYRGPDADYQGREICLGANETALSIADVTDKANPKALSRASYPNVGYSHQGWLTDDHRYFFMDDELDELNGSVTRTRTVIWDVSDLDDPQVAAEFLGTTAASDHNLYIRGDTMYQSNYQAGLRVVDISKVTAPVEVGYFDTVPTGTNTPGFGGSWSNYPYFRSGTIVVTSGSEGVFLLKKRPAPPVS